MHERLGLLSGCYVLGAQHASSIIGNINDITEPTKKYPAIPDRFESFDVQSKETVRGKADMTVRKGDEVRLTTGDEFR